MTRKKNESAGEAISGRLHANPGARLLDAARELFYEHGYAAAGINEIIARSGTSKKSFYNYFPSKARLGEAYLARERADLFDSLDERIADHRDDFRGFLRSWVRDLKQAAAGQAYFGCPFANIAAQTGGQFEEILAATAREWREKLRDFLRGCDLGLSPKRADAFAELMLMQYQGAVQMWRLSGDTHYFDLIEETLKSLAAETPARRRKSSAR
ncbi:MAG: TetR/AcrR family transcriptional regulator [bacterium]|nr:TetR/AcrR family transcriptional regulator [bacterium]